MRKFDTRSVPARHLDWLKGEGMFREKEEGKEGRGDGGKKRGPEGRKEGWGGRDNVALTHILV